MSPPPVSLVIPPALAAEAGRFTPEPLTAATLARRRAALEEHVRVAGLGEMDVTLLPALGGIIARGPVARYDDGCAAFEDYRVPPRDVSFPSPPQTVRLGPGWHLEAAGLDLPRGGAGGHEGALSDDVVVGIIDSGVRPEEAELAHLAAGGRLHFASFEPSGRRGSDAPRDIARGHGTTSVALVAGATIGVEPRAHVAMALAERDRDEPGSAERGWSGLAAIWAAYDWLLSAEHAPGKRGVDVICVNLESHSRAAARFLDLPIRWARRALGVLTVVPAGNRGLSDLASYDEALAVGAHGWDGRAIPPSGYGTSFLGAPKPELLAPGFRVAGFKEVAGRLVSGTSCAAPLVAGSAAWLMRRRPELRGAPDRLSAALWTLCDSERVADESEHTRSAWGRLRLSRLAMDADGTLPGGRKGVGHGLRAVQGGSV
ncbi:MAG: S8/S53 family peptidase [Myxococcales bacterium]|nr:S8/S53 family peptidase [Myxococcales bacterium]MCB9734818.1 S8/S53 family peptidase [Deltaproteobacteria bacterium]